MIAEKPALGAVGFLKLAGTDGVQTRVFPGVEELIWQRARSLDAEGLEGIEARGARSRHPDGEQRDQV